MRSTNTYDGLAEDVAVKLVGEISGSGRFVPMVQSAAANGAAPTVEVPVNSEPPGADVEVDGVFYGNAGSALRLPEGLRMVRISLAGYELWEKKVVIGRGMEVKATLPPLREAR